LKNLNVYEKIAQLIMPRLDFNAPESIERAKKLVEKFCVGGFIVFGGERDQVKEVTEELQATSPSPLLFACDAERGVGQIISGTTQFPFVMSLGAIGDEELVYRQAGFIAEELKECGLNLIFAPVVDVNTNPENPIINIRSYGDDPSLVSRLGAAFIKGCQDRGVLACAKHFPGHGGVAIDSHITLPQLVQSRESLCMCDLIPFKRAIESSVASIMIAHIAAPKIDPVGVPATISSEVIGGLLLHDLGFKGLVITDSFNMGAIAELGEEEDIARLSILSGCDIILDPRQPLELIERLTEMVKIGEIPESLLDSSVEKIIVSKEKWLSTQPPENSLDETYGENLLDEIARRCVCCLKGGRLRSKKVTIYVLDVTQAEEDVSGSFVKHLAEAGIKLEKKSLTPQDAEAFLPEGRNRDQAIICSVYTSVAAWKGHTNLPEPFKRLLRRVSNLHCERVLISFGSPYIVRGLEHFDTILCTFDRLDICQHAVADVLLGQLKAQGSLPVKL
jgi:beta-N-acetylhexosaminidase